MSVKKRRYNYSYIEYGFTCIINNGEKRPQCVIYNKVLSNDSLKPTKLKQHLHNVNQQHKDKSKIFFDWIQMGHIMKRTKMQLKLLTMLLWK